MQYHVSFPSRSISLALRPDVNGDVILPSRVMASQKQAAAKSMAAAQMEECAGRLRGLWDQIHSTLKALQMLVTTRAKDDKHARLPLERAIQSQSPCVFDFFAGDCVQFAARVRRRISRGPL